MSDYYRHDLDIYAHSPAPHRPLPDGAGFALAMILSLPGLAAGITLWGLGASPWLSLLVWILSPAAICLLALAVIATRRAITPRPAGKDLPQLKEIRSHG